MQQDGNGVLYYERINPKDDGCFTVERNKKEKQELNINCAKDIYVLYLKNQIDMKLSEIVQSEEKPAINNTTLNKMIATLEQNNLDEVEMWLQGKLVKSDGKKETKLRSQAKKFQEISSIISDIKKECDAKVVASGLDKLLSRDEKEMYLEELYIKMTKQYLLHYKRGDE